MVVEFNDYVEKLRNNIEGDIDNLFLVSQESQESVINNYFEKLKLKNYELYKQVIGLLVSDHIKILNDLKKINNIINAELRMLDLYKKINSTNDAIDFATNNAQILNMLYYAMIDFNDYDYFCKREIWLNSKEDLSRLSKISPLNMVDYLYYCKKINVELLRKKYSDFELNYLTSNPINEIIHIINELNISDVDNYYDLISELLMEYYVTKKNTKILRGCQNRFGEINSSNIIRKIEMEDNKSLLEDVKNQKFLIEILNPVMQVKNNCNRNHEEDKTYVKTLNKLKNIKDYLK